MHSVTSCGCSGLVRAVHGSIMVHKHGGHGALCYLHFLFPTYFNIFDIIHVHSCLWYIKFSVCALYSVP